MPCEDSALTQWDFAVHRDFPIHESVKLQFRAEMFNLLNHPNFGPPSGNLGGPGAPNPQFGQSLRDARTEPRRNRSISGTVRSILSISSVDLDRYSSR